eukprot:GILJ01032904.1.p1 GENE.GILJ01032904.1~~GILJ01032904.1.p1  ORF type:complete len:183 (-),score=7.67 GILJ01032904.1:20-568(-)
MVLRLKDLPGFRRASVRPFDQQTWIRFIREVYKFPYTDRTTWATFSQWWSYDQCLKLMDEYGERYGIDYRQNVIMKVRPDLRFDQDVNLTSLSSSHPSPSNEIHAMLFPFMNGREWPERLADYYTYGGYDAMHYLAKLYNSIEQYKKRNVHVVEDMLYQYLTSNNQLSISTFPFMGWNIIRV